MARIFFERRGRGDDLRNRLEGLGEEAQVPPGLAGDCAPPMDVVETPDAIEVTLDVPGLSADTVEVLFARGTVVIAGRKEPRSCPHGEAAFHLAERSFGRFARAIPLGGAFDAGRAAATLSAGELRIVLPRIEERRGGEIRIPVKTE